MDAGTVYPWIAHLYNYAWFVGFGVSFGVYYLAMKREIVPEIASATE